MDGVTAELVNRVQSGDDVCQIQENIETAGHT